MAKKVHIVVIFWDHENGQRVRNHNYFSSKKKAAIYLNERREGWKEYNPENKWGYYTTDTIK